jgi:hypothetical protein
MKVLQSAAAMAALVSCGSVVSAGMLVGVASFDQFSTQSLYAIDSATGAATLIGDTGVSEIVGIAWNGSSLYAYTRGADLFTINTTTGAGTLVADNFGVVPEGDLAFDSAGALWSVNAGVLGTIDLVTGAFSAVGPIGSAATDVSALVYAPSFNGGALIGYAHNGVDNDDAIVGFDLATGAASVLASAGLNEPSNLGGADFDADTGTGFLVLGDTLYSIDFVGGPALIGQTGVSGFSGLAVIPAPGMSALAGLAGLVLSRRRRA